MRIFQEPAYASAVRSLSLFSVLTILLLFATGITVGLCYQSFGRGLKTHGQTLSSLSPSLPLDLTFHTSSRQVTLVGVDETIRSTCLSHRSDSHVTRLILFSDSHVTRSILFPPSLTLPLAFEQAKDTSTRSLLLGPDPTHSDPSFFFP